MTGLSILYLVFIALLITLFFAYVLRTKGPWGSIWALFIVIFLSVWAADVWIAPVGPFWGEIYWFRPLVFGLFIAILLAAAAPSPRTRSKIETREQRLRDNTSAAAMGIFFWIMLITVFAFILLGLLFNV